MSSYRAYNNQKQKNWLAKIEPAIQARKAFLKALNEKIGISEQFSYSIGKDEKEDTQREDVFMKLKNLVF